MQYPFDSTGSSPDNFIPNEPHLVSQANAINAYLIVPECAPFFRDAFSIVDSSGNTLVPGIDYYFTHQWAQGSEHTGKLVYGSITLIEGYSAGSYKINYQTIGGEAVLNKANLVTDGLVADSNYAVTLDWTTVPLDLPGTPRTIQLDGITGLAEILHAVEDVTSAIRGKWGNVSINDISDLPEVLIALLYSPIIELIALINNRDVEFIKALIDINTLKNTINAFNISKASAQEITIGANDVKYITPKGLMDSAVVVNEVTSQLNAALGSATSTAAQAAIQAVFNQIVSAVETAIENDPIISAAINSAVSNAVPTEILSIKANPVNTTDFNTMLTTGVYLFSSLPAIGATNRPSKYGGALTIITDSVNGNSVYQEYKTLFNKIYSRTFANQGAGLAWTSWIEVITTAFDLYDNIPPGVPTEIYPPLTPEGNLTAFLAAHPKFKLCDGTNGTPDCVNRFRIGTDKDDVNGIPYVDITGVDSSIGGSKDAVLVEHSHPGKLFTNTTNVSNLGGNGDTALHGNDPTDIPPSGESGINKNLPPYIAMCVVIRTTL